MEIVYNILLSKFAEHCDFIFIVTHFIELFVSKLAFGVAPDLKP
jgi:hypothetical protein